MLRMVRRATACNGWRCQSHHKESFNLFARRSCVPQVPVKSTRRTRRLSSTSTSTTISSSFAKVVILSAAAAGTLLYSIQSQPTPPCRLESVAASTTGSTSTTAAYQPQEHNETSSNSSSAFKLKQMYDIEQVLGQGAYGMVYRARRKYDGVKVALKTMPREFTGQTDFEREVAALQVLSLSSQATTSDDQNHHVVKLYDLHRDEKNYYLAMELVEGVELFQHLLDNGPYSEALASSFVRQFAEALCFVHSSGYAHADLKPENLMLTTTATGNNDHLQLKVVDFGCACTHDQGRNEMHLPADEFSKGCSFLHQVALGNQFMLQRILQDRPNLVNFRDYDKRTSLHIAASEGHLDICRFLVQRGAKVNRVDRWGGSPLDDAHRHGHTEVFEFLGQHGAKFGSTAAAIERFITAASQGDVQEIRALLEYGGATIDLNQGDYDDRRALHLAAGEGHVDVVKLLCEAGADVKVTDRWGNSPLDDAKRAKTNSTAIIKILEEFGASLPSSAANNSDSTIATTSWTTFQAKTNSALPEKFGGKTQPLDKVSGTIAYASPELFDKGAVPTPASDMWAAGVIVYILLTGSHPFDKNADSTDEEIALRLIQVGSSTKAKGGEQLEPDLLSTLVFDERVEGLSDSCIDLMKKLMHPKPDKRMTSDDFRRHPWVQGLTASWDSMAKGFGQLDSTFWQKRFREEILKKFATHGRLILSEHEVESMFRALDLKQNGVLDLDEITRFFRTLDIPDAAIQNIFSSADLDGTGVIRWDEFQALIMSKPTGDDGAAAADGGRSLRSRYLQNRFKAHIRNRFGKRQLRDIFNAIDLEGNGKLDPHELRVVLRSAGEPEDVISRIVASLDVNRDGGVDWSEFQDIMGVRSED